MLRAFACRNSPRAPPDAPITRKRLFSGSPISGNQMKEMADYSGCANFVMARQFSSCTIAQRGFFGLVLLIVSALFTPIAIGAFVRKFIRICIIGGTFVAASPVLATLTVTPLGWNVIGIESNSPATAPRNFPVGARVCTDADKAGVSAQLVWDSANANIGIRPGTSDTLVFGAMLAGAYRDAYYEVAVNPIAAAFDTMRRYHVAATDTFGSYSTATPRELYVEHLISKKPPEQEFRRWCDLRVCVV
jgi:hypothetical protein